MSNSLIVKSLTSLPFQELGINTQLLIENNSFKGQTGLFWGVQEVIWEMADKYEISYDLLYFLAKCESGLIHENRWGDQGLSYGLYQWQKASWNLYNKKFNLDLDIKNSKDQTELTALVIKNGGEHNWKNCFRKIRILADKI